MANSDYVTKHSNLEHIFDRFGNKLSTRSLREYLAKIDTEETEVKNIATRFYINEIH
jgi:glycine betaine/choline ABC-type transport system substrate-binding protein